MSSGYTVIEVRDDDLDDEDEASLVIARILESNDHLHDEETLLEDHDSNELKLFWHMLEWMEIESAIVKSYNSLKTTTTTPTAFRQEELETVDKVLKEVDRIVLAIMGDFFSELYFACGVLNTILVVFVFSKLPQHFGLLYLVEGLYLLPRNFYLRLKSKPLNRGFTYLDFCWLMNCVALFALIGLVLHPILAFPFPRAVRKQLFIATMGTACGPLMGAALVLPFVALLFHDLNTITGLFIHVLPPMVAYTLRWHSLKVHDAWPRVFSLDYLSEVTFFPGEEAFLGTVAGNATAFYVVWFVLYVAWMSLFGMDLPRKDRFNAENGQRIIPKYDTCFHIAMRGGACIVIGRRFRGRSRTESLEQMKLNHFERMDLAIYMCTHAIMAMSSIFILGFVCYTFQDAHAWLIRIMAVVCTIRGARRYTYYTSHMYSKMLRMHFKVLVAQQRQVGRHDEHYLPKLQQQYHRD